MGNMNEPWPNDAVLYQPFEDEQILLAEKASCSAVKAYLRMCNLPYDVQFRANAEFMSPGGQMTKLPVLKVSGFVLAEFEPIVNFVEQRSESISRWMMEDEKTEMRSFICLIENTFTLAEMYCSFMLKGVYDEVTAPRNGCVFPWPLNKIQNLSKRHQAEKMLKIYQWTDMNFDDVLEKVSTCCRYLEMKLEESFGPYFYGERPCELDALVFGHLSSILTTNLPNNGTISCSINEKYRSYTITQIGLGINYYTAMPLSGKVDMKILSFYLQMPRSIYQNFDKCNLKWEQKQEQELEEPFKLTSEKRLNPTKFEKKYADSFLYNWGQLMAEFMLKHIFDFLRIDFLNAVTLFYLNIYQVIVLWV
ncbi:hypothetical protein GQX74_010433 [Glossina fuscipes]|nr:hypothetical protein GQX74_010433 [Glossina fuscipes]